VRDGLIVRAHVSQLAGCALDPLVTRHDAALISVHFVEGHDGLRGVHDCVGYLAVCGMTGFHRVFDVCLVLVADGFV
jgi:hypothetical protein